MISPRICTTTFMEQTAVQGNFFLNKNMLAADLCRIDKPEFDRILMSNAMPGAAIQEQHMWDLATDVASPHQSNNQVPYASSSQHGKVAGAMAVNVDDGFQRTSGNIGTVVWPVAGGRCPSQSTVAERMVAPLALYEQSQLPAISSAYVKSGNMLCHVAKRRKDVLNLPGIEDEEVDYRIIGGHQEKDPYKHKPAPHVRERVHQSVYIPKAWLSIPVDLWVSSVNWGVLLLVIALQTLLTWAVFYTSDTQAKPCRGFCNSYITIDFSTHNLTGVAIFFLLGFRSSNSYSRFWEGRALWGTTVAVCRDFTQRLVHVLHSQKDPLDPQKLRRICSFIIAYAVTQKQHLRNIKNLEELESILSIQDIRNIQQADNMPLYCTDVIRYFLYEANEAGQLKNACLKDLDSCITGLINVLGACERIKSQTTPVAFVVHMRAFLVIWLITLPLVLGEKMAWVTIFVCTIVDFAILGIDGMSVEIENPFGYDKNDLPLALLCETVAKDVRELLDRSLHPHRKLALDGEPPPLWPGTNLKP